MICETRRIRSVIMLAALAVLLSGCAAANTSMGQYAIPTGNRDEGGKSGPAVLGGMDQAFITELGQPVDLFGFQSNESASSKVIAFDHYPNTFVDGVVAERDISNSKLAHRIVLIILSSPPDQLWLPDTARKYCLSYAPRDALFVRREPVRNAQGMGGTDMVYYSSSLAHLFPASNFIDEHSDLVTPGLFNIQYIYPSANQSKQILSCQLALGTRQTYYS